MLFLYFWRWLNRPTPGTDFYTREPSPPAPPHSALAPRRRSEQQDIRVSTILESPCCWFAYCLFVAVTNIAVEHVHGTWRCFASMYADAYVRFVADVDLCGQRGSQWKCTPLLMHLRGSLVSFLFAASSERPESGGWMCRWFEV